MQLLLLLLLLLFDQLWNGPGKILPSSCRPSHPPFCLFSALLGRVLVGANTMEGLMMSMIIILINHLHQVKVCSSSMSTSVPFLMTGSIVATCCLHAMRHPTSYANKETGSPVERKQWRQTDIIFMVHSSITLAGGHSISHFLLNWFAD